ncbi:hypothetical protein NFI96_021878 [Prochilodus magdalenae]|nr:hypothetical protein NFI96_021878 [Prochilodus magdalenae]
MRGVILLFCFFAGTAETFALQPSLNVTALLNGSMEVAEWSHSAWPSAGEHEEEKWLEEPRTWVNATTTEEEEAKTPFGTLKEEDRGEGQENRAEREENTGGKNDPGDPGRLPPSPRPPTVPQLLNQHNTTSQASRYVQPTVRPLVSSVTQSPAAITQAFTDRTTSLPAPEARHVLITDLSTHLTNETSPDDANSSVAQVEEANPKEIKVTPTAMAARGGPTAMSRPSTLRPKPQPETSVKDKLTDKGKKDGLLRKHKAKEKKTKAQKKGKSLKKLGRERDEETTPPHFPYFKDDYCPPDCACYGRVVQCSDKELDKIPYGIPYNSRYVLLMNNRIDRIPLDLLSEYLSMEFLVLTNNRLTDSSAEGAFEGIPALKRLYLERNFLQSIPADLPTSLEELRLDGNKVRVMAEAAWRRCPGLLILSLSNNSLGSQAIPAGVLTPLVTLRTLSLSHNQLTSVPLNLPLSLQELYIRGNHIQRFQNGIFQGRAELLVLDLSANRLTNKGLGKAALINATRLESLNLEGNLLKHVPRHLPRSLKTLNLEGNSISSVSKAVFLSLPHLEHLGLARNKISKVAPGAFLMLSLLHQLDLSHNALRQVPRQLPTWLFSIALTHNKIRTIPRDSFCWAKRDRTPSSRLVRVQLEDNLVDLGSVDSEAFSCLRGFQVVHFY